MLRKHNSSASALMLVLWATLIMSAAIFTWTALIRNQLKLTGSTGIALEAKAMAHSGVSVALHSKIGRQSPALNGSFGDGLNYRVRMVSEGGKLNINWIAQDADIRKISILSHWLAGRGLNIRERQVFIDCLLDYIDPDNVKRLDGAEEDGTYHPANRPLLDVSEVSAVANSGPLTSKAGWKEQLTVDSSGPIDLSSSPEDILRLLPGFTEARIKRLLQLRRGPDGVEGTADDVEFKSVDQALSSIGFSSSERKAINGLVEVNDPVVRIYSTGKSGKASHVVEVVARKGGLKPVILSWSE